MLNAEGVHYNPDFFTDPTSFQPERWMNLKMPVSNESFRSFSRGNRTCLRMNLAMNQMKVALTMIIRDFNFCCADLRPNPKTRADDVEVDTMFGDVVFQEIGLEAKSRGPMMMMLAKRRERT